MLDSGREGTAQYRDDKAQSCWPSPIQAGAAAWRSRNTTESTSTIRRSRSEKARHHDTGVEVRKVGATIIGDYRLPAEVMLENGLLKKAGRWGGQYLICTGSEKLEIMEFVERSSLSVRGALRSAG